MNPSSDVETKVDGDLGIRNLDVMDRPRKRRATKVKGSAPTRRSSRLIDQQNVALDAGSPVAPDNGQAIKASGAEGANKRQLSERAEQLALNTAEHNTLGGWMPTAETGYRFPEDDTEAGVKGKQLNTTLKPPARLRADPDAFIEKSYRKLGDMPAPGLADRLVEKMEREEAKYQRMQNSEEDEEEDWMDKPVSEWFK